MENNNSVCYVGRVTYHPKNTILRCHKCQYENIEWYNDQPGDECLVDNCNGRYFREFKQEEFLNK